MMSCQKNAGPDEPLPPGKLLQVITYLEMGAPPGQRPSQVNPEGIRVARSVHITADFYRHLYQSVGKPWLWYERNHLTDPALDRIINHPANHLYILYVGDKAAGFAELDFRRPPDLELAYFGLMPDQIGKGYGRLLLKSAIEMGWKLGPDRLWVHTCNHDHPYALTLYQEEGFIPYHKEEIIIDDPRMSDNPLV